MSRVNWFSVAVAASALGASFLFGGPSWGFVFLAVGVVALAIWHLARDSGLHDPDEHTSLGKIQDDEGEAEHASEPSSTLAILAEHGATISFPQTRRTQGPSESSDACHESTTVEVLEWRGGNTADTRPEYRDWSHVIFRLGGNTSERGRFHIEVRSGDGNTATDRVPACIEGQHEWAHEVAALKPGEQYLVWVFMRLTEEYRLWIDERRYSRVLGSQPTWLAAGSYITGSDFLDNVRRQPLPRGTYQVRVVLIIGDVAHNVEHCSDWRPFDVT